jgi:hypothetical protein
VADEEGEAMAMDFGLLGAVARIVAITHKTRGAIINGVLAAIENPVYDTGLA